MTAFIYKIGLVYKNACFKDVVCVNIIQETFIHTHSTRQETGRVTIFNIRGSI